MARTIKTIGALAVLLATLFCATVTQAEQKFDHFATGFPLTGGHVNVDCSNCHISGIFKGTPTRCAACHGQGGAVSASSKPAKHVRSSDNCDSCHSSQHWATGIRMDHTNVSGSCETCHNGVIATGKGTGHISTTGFTCDQCHNTLTWFGAKFNHSNVAAGTCGSRCHNGTVATGKGGSHIATNLECDSCHTTRSWAFNHSAVRAGSCADCHNGVTATGKNSGHITTTASCDVCHTTRAWTPASFSHTTPNYPYGHRTLSSCSSCHTGALGNGIVNWNGYPPSVSPCLGCHVSAFTKEHKLSDTGKYNCTRSGCHSVSTWNR